MFGHSEIGTYAFGEFPALRTMFAIVARLAVLPRYLGRSDAKPAIGVSLQSLPR